MHGRLSYLEMIIIILNINCSLDRNFKERFRRTPCCQFITGDSYFVRQEGVKKSKIKVLHRVKPQSNSQEEI